VIGGASATEIHEWLVAHGYDLPASSVPLLDVYVMAGQRFVALRLRNDATVQEIQPISLGFGALPPCLPIRLTAIATEPDLPITAFFLARTRATARNYSSIETPFPGTLWSGAVTYDQWVSNTADDLGGQAFITDFAGPTPRLGVALPPIDDLAMASRPEEIVFGLISRGYANDSLLAGLILRFIEPPEGQIPASYLNCLARFGSCGEPASFDPAGLVAAVETSIREPRARAQAWLEERPYLSRLYTTMSAEEMTVDPEFVLDDGLGDASNVHVARLVTECDAEHLLEDAAQRLELPSGESFALRAARTSWSDREYCARRGGWVAGTDASVPGLDAAVPESVEADAGTSTTVVGGGGGCSCSARARTPASGVGAGLVALFALGLARRRGRAARALDEPRARGRTRWAGSSARWAIALAVFVTALLAPRTAHACGGFFCQSVPVAQTGEQIVYAIDDDGALTMSVRINYQGEAPEFAWILPVPETPVISLGADVLFDALERTTRPWFGVVDGGIEGVCRTPPECAYPPPPPVPDGGPFVFSDASVSFSGDAGSAGPIVFAESSLGPFETVVIGGASATVIHEWLATHGYDLPASAIPILDDYVAGGQRFVALRLRNDASVQEIQPITLRFTPQDPCLPIRLTAIATQPDLPITAYFLARTRATTRNYSLLEPRYAPELYLNRVAYGTWASNAVDDAGGHAFIPEYAGATPAVGTFALPPVDDLATETSAAAFVQALLVRGYMGDAQLAAILSRFLTPPPGLDLPSYVNCLAFGGTCGDPERFDPAGLAVAIALAITGPRSDADAMVAGHPYTTRLFTTMSAEEMTVDPEFVLDDGLGDVSNVHEARRITECNEDTFFERARIRVDFPEGGSIEERRGIRGGTAEDYCRWRGGWPAELDASPGLDAWVPPGVDGGVRPPSLGGGRGCSAGARRGGAGALVLLAVMAGVLVRRRR
jgi:hypothetical protein